MSRTIVDDKGVPLPAGWPSAGFVSLSAPFAATGEGVDSLGDRIAFWAAVAITLAFSQCWVMVLTGPGSDPVDPATSALARNVFFPVYLGVLALALTRFRGVASAMARSPLLILLLVVTFASITWSIDPGVTARRCVAGLFTALAGLTLAERFAWPKFLEVLATTFGILVALCFAFALFAPQYGKMSVDFPGAWRGVWGHKNLLGYNMSVAFTVFAASALANPKRRWLWVAAMAAALILIVLSVSKTSLASCLMGAGCVFLVGLARRGPAGAVAATYLWVAALAVLVFVLFASPDLLPALLGKDSTFTGRTRIWAAVLHQIAQQPLTGYGYGAVWDNTSLWSPLPHISREQGFVIHEAHNAWLGIWLDLGLVGLVAWALLFASVWIKTLFALYVRPAAYFVLPFLAVFSLHTLTEAAVLSPNDFIWLIFTATAVKLAAPG